LIGQRLDLLLFLLRRLLRRVSFGRSTAIYLGTVRRDRSAAAAAGMVILFVMLTSAGKGWKQFP
jgi:hypothetical protein